LTLFFYPVIVAFIYREGGGYYGNNYFSFVRYKLGGWGYWFWHRLFNREGYKMNDDCKDEEIKDLMDGLFKGLTRDKDEKPDYFREKQERNQETIDDEEEWEDYEPFPGIGLEL
jgi:hypothetical protein